MAHILRGLSPAGDAQPTLEDIRAEVLAPERLNVRRLGFYRHRPGLMMASRAYWRFILLHPIRCPAGDRIGAAPALAGVVGGRLVVAISVPLESLPASSWQPRHRCFAAVALPNAAIARPPSSAPRRRGFVTAGRTRMDDLRRSPDNPKSPYVFGPGRHEHHEALPAG
jgi:hypothetical protein